jgi:transcription-repair coupling factor (superfamily II helicase)
MQLPKFNSAETYNIHSVPEGSEVFLLQKILHSNQSGIMHVCLNDLHLSRLKDLLRFFTPEIKIYELPAWDTTPYDRVSPQPAIISERIRTLYELREGLPKNVILLTTISAITQRVLPREILRKSSLIAKAGDKIDRGFLANFLVENGYFNVGTTTDHGEFSLRGSIIDIFPPTLDYGIRIDFFGDEVESLRTFDPLTQISDSKIEKLEILPANEVLFTEAYIENFKKNYLKNFARENVGTIKNEPIYLAISESRKYGGMENYLPLFYNNLETIFDYIPDAIITFENLSDAAIAEREENIKDAYEGRKYAAKNAAFKDSNYNVLEPEKLYVLGAELQNKLSKQAQIHFSFFDKSELGKNELRSDYKPILNFASESKIQQKSAFDILKDKISNQIITSKGKIKVNALIACATEGSKSRMQNLLNEHEIKTYEVSDFIKEQGLFGKNTVGLAICPLEKGFEAEGFTIISEADLLGEKIYRSGRRFKKSENFTQEVANLQPDEIVVHKEHGIGRFKSLETIKVGGAYHDFILIEYSGSDRLYVPVENIDLITRYGSENESTVLDRLGSLAWQERTAKVKKRVLEMAGELLEIAAARELNQAKIFDLHDDIGARGSYDEFCARFPFAETEDQLNSTNDIINDLTSGKPMDRLICGDVGFGKTEVAMRAAFIVANPQNLGRGQVAVICPTTILARQHYKNFKNRFEGFGIEVRQLSRMVTAKETRQTKELLAEGKVDIVVGTHALLADSTKFANLNMVIIDEEQKFGVAQKEKLKKFKSETHVLSLSATPIPRTLQLSLSGIRELSLIATPPVDRLAVRTFVVPFDGLAVREAILKEHYRGGKTFFVCPRIKDIDEVKKKLAEIIPEVKTVVAHGQMKPQELDKIMNDFYDGKFDVLLSTTIVESGIDVPTANTIILYRADMYGLAELYQLRGRVGRGKTRGYAYLLLPARKIPTKHAIKRLEVMQKLDGLGAGFSLASHDMDIRGFGNLLGDKQSGNIKEVGIELYQDMLKDAILKLKDARQTAQNSEAKTEEKQDYSVKINIGTSVLIPENYISDIELRMGLYRRIGQLENDQEIESFAAEMVDRFGKIPQEFENLLSTLKIKQICKKLQIEKIDAGEKGAVISFYNNSFNNPDILIRLVSKNPITYKIKDGTKFVIANQNWADANLRMNAVKKELTEIYNMVATA